MPHAVDFAGLHVAVRFLAAAAYENLNGTTVVFPCPNSNKLSGRAQRRDSVRVGSALVGPGQRPARPEPAARQSSWPVAKLARPGTSPRGCQSPSESSESEPESCGQPRLSLSDDHPESRGPGSPMIMTRMVIMLPAGRAPAVGPTAGRRLP